MSAAPALTPAAEFREKVWAEERQKGGGLLAYTLEELAVTTFPDRRPLLCRGDVPVLSEGDIGQLTATRGNGKTWFLQTLALVASAQIEALGF